MHCFFFLILRDERSENKKFASSSFIKKFVLQVMSIVKNEKMTLYMAKLIFVQLQIDIMLICTPPIIFFF